MTTKPACGARLEPGTVTCEKRGAIWILAIANQSKRNAFNRDMSASLQRYLEEADATSAVRCVVVTGAGDHAFSSGHDLKERAWQESSAKDANAAFVYPSVMSKPTIAAVNGHAYAGGFVLALNCDLRVVSRNASFCASGAKLGLLPVAGQLSRLPVLLPPAKALELLMTGVPIPAEEAYTLGFANRLVNKGEALQAAVLMAEGIARNSPAVIREIKRGVNIRLRDGLVAATDFEIAVGAKLKGGADHKEGVRAFLEKRLPLFKDLTEGEKE